MLANTLEDLSAEDVIDSRDLEETITELEDERAEALEDDEASWNNPDGAELLDALQALRQATEDEGWHDGIGFIRDSHFEDYARGLADDIGAVNAEATWPNNCIDWERAARELQQDYSTVEIGRVTFWYREA